MRLRSWVPSYSEGSNEATRVISKFLLFPLRLGYGDYRWLETVHIKQKAHTVYGNAGLSKMYFWMNVSWVDDYIEATKK